MQLLQPALSEDGCHAFVSAGRCLYLGVTTLKFTASQEPKESGFWDVCGSVFAKGVVFLCVLIAQNNFVINNVHLIAWAGLTVGICLYQVGTPFLYQL